MLENEIIQILAKARFKERSDTLKNWEEKNPILLSGEFGVVVGLNEVGDKLEDKTKKIKIGDGTHAWKELEWVGEFEAEIIKYLTYNISDDEVVITKCDTSISGKHNIPEKIEGYPVTSIGDSAFHSCESLTSIIIPNSVTSIGAQAFYWCASLKNITIPDGVESLSTNMFGNCISLESITIPNSVTSIGNSAFFACKNLKSIIIPDGVTSIGGTTFSTCLSLKSVTIPDGVTNIGESAFSGCNSLTDVYYCGTKEQWENITIGDYNNSALRNATIHYNQSFNALNEVIGDIETALDELHNYAQAIVGGA